MNHNEKNNKEIPVDYLEEKDKKTTEAEEKKEQKKERKRVNYKKLYEETLEKYKALNEQFLRFRAEFANYKKRVEREQIELSNYLKGEFIKKILPVLDDFNHMLKKSVEGTNEQSILEGAKIIHDKFYQILKAEGLEKIEAEGKDFDPQIHEAMMMQKTPDQKKHNKILNVFQDGYKLKDKLIRPAKVIVGNYQEEN